MKIKIATICLLLTALLGGCNKWIDVKPSDRLAEKELFSSKEGYLTALNGVYAELTNSAIYGENMTVSSLDVMANYYYMTLSTHQYYDFAIFTYTSSRAKTVFDNMWKKAYELIVNTNIIIDQCGDSTNALLPAPYHGIVKGEALALRAMLHFDMLRLFGPIYTEADKGRVCIPYNISSTPQVSALLSSEEIMNKVIGDLTAALALLKPADPVITSGVRHGANPSGANDLYYRQYRLNYYAVKALLARAYLWKGDKVKALDEAQQILATVLDPAKPIFKVGPTNPTAIIADFDHLFTQEVMFSLYVINRQTNIYSAFFSPDQDKSRRLPFNNNDDNQTRKTALYDDQNDYRLKAWLTLTNTNGNFLTHVKYGVTTNGPGPNMIPLIRLSEVLLMAAECSPTLEGGTNYLNLLRTGRNCVNLAPATTAQLNDFIMKEFRKEVFGEGQLFFYFKRTGATAIPNNANLTNTKQMLPGNYIVPLPLSEVSVRGN